MTDKSLYTTFERNSETLISEFDTYISNRKPVSITASKLLYLNTSLFNHFLEKLNYPDYNIETEYPLFYNKFWAKKTVSAVEMGEFIESSIMITPENIQHYIYTTESLLDFNDARETKATAPKSFLVIKSITDRENPKNVLSEFEFYLSRTESQNKLSSSSFCSMATNVFQSVDKFTNVWNNIESLGGKIEGAFDDITTISLNGLVDTITEYIKKKFKEYQEQIKNMVLSKITGSNYMSRHVAERVLGKTLKMKEDLADFFSDNVMEKIITKIKSMVSYVSSLFEDLKIEEIEYMVYKFCQLSSTIEHVLDSEISNFKKFIQGADEVNLALQTSSNYNTANAINAGALRFPPQVYNNAVVDERGKFADISVQTGGNYTTPVSVEDIDGVTSWNDGKGDSRIQFVGRWPSVLGRIGWEKVDPTVRVKLMQIQATLGIQLYVNSGFRTVEYNATLSGAAPESKHLNGEALDISWNDFRGSSTAYKSNFVRIAKEVGFRGIGGYDGFIHIDVGPERRWGIVY